MQTALDKLDKELKDQAPPSGASMPLPAHGQSAAVQQESSRRHAIACAFQKFTYSHA
jgi:hypothetical protein